MDMHSDEKIFDPWRWRDAVRTFYLSKSSYEEACADMQKGVCLEVEVDMRTHHAPLLWKVGDELQLRPMHDPSERIRVNVEEVAIVDGVYHYFLLTSWGRIVQAAQRGYNDE